MSRPRSVLVLGAGHAAGVLARSLRDEGYDGRITVAGEERWLPYERPPLSKGLLLGQQSPADAQLHDADWYATADVALQLGQPVVSVGEGRATLADGTALEGEAMVFATGARARALAVPGAELANVRLLRSLDDALGIRDALRPGARVAIVGAGLLGLEAAAAARQIGAEVTVVETSGSALQRVLPRVVAGHVVDMHRAHGVRFHFDTVVTAFEGGDAVERVILSDGSTLAANLAIVAIGALPNDALARAAGLAVDDGILVDAYCRASRPGIYAVGDVTRHYSPWAEAHRRLESWQNAQNQARACARVLLGRSQAYADVPWAWTDQYDTSIQFTGDVGDDTRQIRRDDASGGFSVLCLRGEVMVGAVGVNRPRDVRDARAAIAARGRPDVAQLADVRRPLRAIFASREKGPA